VISVILPYRDVEATLGEALASTLADLGPGDELVAVDDGSSDGSAQVVREIARTDARLVAHASGGTQARAAGIVRSLGLGIEVARGSLVGRMDGDDVTLPGRFAETRALLESDARLGVVATRAEAFPAPGPGMLRYVAWQNSLVTPEDHARAIFVESPLCHPSTLMRRDALERVGGYRDEAWAEDYDLWLRFDAAGFAMAKVPEVRVRWRMRDESLTRTDPHYAPERLLEARARYLARRLARGTGRDTGERRPFAVWGAGKTGRHLVRALEREGARPAFFVDVDAKKVGRLARGLCILAPEPGLARVAREGATLVVAVGEAGARDEVRARLSLGGLVEGRDFLCGA